ncbi:extracellular solute-binding protein [Ectobacillus polymachus]|uniref:extracellular solute-binding protein n=1 Tax=Ectobacillus polymachus TaxID=1508806 RepID=UPI003A8AE545
MKKLMLIMVGLMLSISLVACGKADSGNKPAGDKAAKDKTLVIYSNSASDGRGDWLTKKAAEAGFKIQVVQAGGGDLLNRLIAEKNKPVADVVYGLNQTNFETLKTNNLLVPYQPKWINEIPASYRQPGNFYNPLVEQRIIMIYNKDVYTPETAPKDWTDLIENKQFAGKYNVPTDLGSATNRAVIDGILMRNLDPKGDLGVSDKGWAEIKSFFDNGYKAPKGEDAFKNLASGKVPISFTYSSGLAGYEKQYGFKAGIVSPEIGVPSLVEQVGIINKGKDQDTTVAKQFVDWFGSAEVQGEWAKQFGTLPVNEKAVNQASDQIKSISQNTKVQKMDDNFVAQHIDKWVEKIQLNILK